MLPAKQDVVVFQCRNPVHRAHYELFTRALHAPNVREGAVCLVHPTCGPTQVGWQHCVARAELKLQRNLQERQQLLQEAVTKSDRVQHVFE